ncbi:MAG: CopD family protein [Chloroflexi bacterium]|nr:CopD family protein [Chloroflexota bacterium]
MTAGAVLLAVISWVHLLAAVAWIGGGLFYLLVLRPALSQEALGQSGGPLTRAVAEQFRGAVELAIVVLLVTGAILTFQRLTAPQATAAYALVLGIKIALSVALFGLAYWLGRRGAVERLLGARAADAAPRSPRRRLPSPATATVLLGAAILLLAELLRLLFR